MIQIIVEVKSVPNNSKNRSVEVVHDNDNYTITLGRRYLYMIHHETQTAYKVRHSITLLDLFSEVEAKTPHSNKLVTHIKDTSLRETQELRTKLYTQKIK